MVPGEESQTPQVGDNMTPLANDVPTIDDDEANWGARSASSYPADKEGSPTRFYSTCMKGPLSKGPTSYCLAYWCNDVRNQLRIDSAKWPTRCADRAGVVPYLLAVLRVRENTCSCTVLLGVIHHPRLASRVLPVASVRGAGYLGRTAHEHSRLGNVLQGQQATTLGHMVVLAWCRPEIDRTCTRHRPTFGPPSVRIGLGGSRASAIPTLLPALQVHSRGGADSCKHNFPNKLSSGLPHLGGLDAWCLIVFGGHCYA